jgi:hypothetical protein
MVGFLFLAFSSPVLQGAPQRREHRTAQKPGDAEFLVLDKSP